MAITLVLPDDDLRFLRAQLQARLRWLDDELIHTDRHEAQHALASDVDRLRALDRRLAAALESSAA